MKTTKFAFFAFFAWLLRYFFAISSLFCLHHLATVSLRFRLGFAWEAKPKRSWSEDGANTLRNLGEMHEIQLQKFCGFLLTKLYFLTFKFQSLCLK